MTRDLTKGCLEMLCLLRLIELQRVVHRVIVEERERGPRARSNFPLHAHHHEIMARPEEKARAMLNKWVKMR